MALVPIKTSTGTGYCDCICGCYDLVALRDEESGKGFCARCAKEHLERNRGVGLRQRPPSQEPVGATPDHLPGVPEPADPPGKLR